jgi:hypothetical protein
MPRWAASSGLRVLEEKTSAFHADEQGSPRKGDKMATISLTHPSSEVDNDM